MPTRRDRAGGVSRISTRRGWKGPFALYAKEDWVQKLSRVPSGPAIERRIFSGWKLSRNIGEVIWKKERLLVQTAWNCYKIRKKVSLFSNCAVCSSLEALLWELKGKFQLFAGMGSLNWKIYYVTRRLEATFIIRYEVIHELLLL